MFMFGAAFLPTHSAIFDVYGYPEVITEPQKLVVNTQKTFSNPLKTIKINQGFSIFHPAIDYDGEIGDEVYPIAAGTVEDIQHAKTGYGNAIIVNHGSGLTSLYAHLSQVKVEAGQDVTKDEAIGLIGSTGHSSGSHLHLEIRDNGIPVNPLIILNQQ